MYAKRIPRINKGTRTKLTQEAKTKYLPRKTCPKYLRYYLCTETLHGTETLMFRHRTKHWAESSTETLVCPKHLVPKQFRNTYMFRNSVPKHLYVPKQCSETPFMYRNTCLFRACSETLYENLYINSSISSLTAE
jgi:hypothetical protein